MQPPRYKPEMILDNRFRLINNVQTTYAHIDSWHAEAQSGQQVMLKIIHIPRQQVKFSNTTNTIMQTIEQLNTQDMTQNRADGIGAWRETMWLDDDTFVMVRPYYPETLLDDVIRNDIPSVNSYINHLGQLASALDYAYTDSGGKFRLLPSNVMLDSAGRWVISDYDLYHVHMTLNWDHAVLAILPDRLAQTMAMYGADNKPATNHFDAVYMLASLYYFLRTRHALFALPHVTGKLPTSLHEMNVQRMQTFAKTGDLSLDSVENHAEREVLARALSIEKHFADTSTFLQALKASLAM